MTLTVAVVEEDPNIAAVPESSQVTVELPESSEVTVDHHEPSQVTTDLHESSQGRYSWVKYRLSWSPRVSSRLSWSPIVSSRLSWSSRVLSCPVCCTQGQPFGIPVWYPVWGMHRWCLHAQMVSPNQLTLALLFLNWFPCLQNFPNGELLYGVFGLHTLLPKLQSQRCLQKDLQRWQLRLQNLQRLRCRSRFSRGGRFYSSPQCHMIFQQSF